MGGDAPGGSVTVVPCCKMRDAACRACPQVTAQAQSLRSEVATERPVLAPLCACCGGACCRLPFCAPLALALDRKDKRLRDACSPAQRHASARQALARSQPDVTGMWAGSPGSHPGPLKW